VVRATARRPLTVEKGRKLPAPLVGPFAPIKPPGAPREDGQNRPSIWVRLRVRWKRRDLDAALADGANPATSAELALRAEQLAEPAMRARIAAGIENLFRLATEGPGPRATTAMVVSTFDRRRLAANRPGLAALSARLRGEGPHTVRGLAMASILLDDDESPLYAPTTVDELEPAVRATIWALDPASQMGKKAHWPRSAPRRPLVHGHGPARE
jgi:hypothetical protein